MLHKKIVIALLCLLFSAGCKARVKSNSEQQSSKTTIVTPTMKRGEISATTSRGRDSYTQGYEFYNDLLYESSGMYSQSYLRQLEYPSFKEVKRVKLEDKYFAEGITVLNDQLYMITWREGRCFVYNPTTLEQTSTFSYSGEGWGLTNDGQYLYMSDGSSTIYRRDPATFSILEKIEVTTPNGSVNLLNELEWINGKIWANVYTTDYIVVINPKSGVVEQILDFSAILAPSLRNDQTDVLNGIAREPKSGKIFITGKYWPAIFEIKQ